MTTNHNAHFTPFGFGQPDEIELELASPWLRMGAIFWDRLLTLLVMLPYYGFFLWKNVQLIWIGVFVQVLFYLTQVFFMSKNGQSLGKRVMGIRVIQTNGDQADWVKNVLLREVMPFLLMSVLVWGWVFFFTQIQPIIFVNQHIKDTFVQYLGTAILFCVVPMCVLDLVCGAMMLMNREYRTIKDYFANTVVVKLPQFD